MLCNFMIFCLRKSEFYIDRECVLSKRYNRNCGCCLGLSDWAASYRLFAFTVLLTEIRHLHKIVANMTISKKEM
jgi:hypothetical protein